jgi:hypothetical protein
MLPGIHTSESPGTPNHHPPSTRRASQRPALLSPLKESPDGPDDVYRHDRSGQSARRSTLYQPSRMAPPAVPTSSLVRLLSALDYPRVGNFSLDGELRVSQTGLPLVLLKGPCTLTHPSEQVADRALIRPTDATELSRVVTWVEDRKVRLYDIDQRAGLRSPGQAWGAAFQKVRAPWSPTCNEYHPA